MIASQPSRTALRVALRRAAHQVHDAAPLVFPDPLAVRILGPAYAAEIARTPDALKRPYSAALRAWIVARARLTEDALAARYRDHGVRQYLLLGAGLDTYAYRQRLPGVRVFEVDHPATQAWKRELLTAAGIPLPDTLRLVPVDFERGALGVELQAAGFDFEAPTMVAWLGVVPYLTADAFRATLALLGGLAAGSAVMFDYSLPREALSAQEQMMLDSLAARVAQAGEPFRLFFRPEELDVALRNAGFQVLEDLEAAVIRRRLFANRTDHLDLRGRAGRVCYAERSPRYKPGMSCN